MTGHHDTTTEPAAQQGGPDRLGDLTCCHRRFLVIFRMALGARAISWAWIAKGRGLRRDADG
jgi:hypothetical protein